MWIQKAEIVNGEIKYNILGKINEDEIYDELIIRLIPIEESPIGVIDGVNKIFQTSLDFFSESIEVFINGLKQISALHYVTIGLNSIELSEAPLAGDLVITKYIRRNL